MKIIVATAVLLMPAPALAFDGLAFAFAIAGAALPALAGDAQTTQAPAASFGTAPARDVSGASAPARFASSGAPRSAGARSATTKSKLSAHRVAVASPARIRH
jgi:hypothetical protein